jgi:hypothetical protein
MNESLPPHSRRKTAMTNHTARPDPRALNFEDGAQLPDVDSCAYCGTPFNGTDLFWLSAQATHDSIPFRIARCPACTAVHRQGTCGRCNTDAYHPTEDNTPWGESSCRVCAMPDPFTHLLGFVATAVSRTRTLTAQVESLQTHNTELLLARRAKDARIAELEARLDERGDL